MNGGMAIRPRLLLLAALLAAGARPVGAAPAPAAVIDQRLAADYPSLFALYQDFHAHPELSLKEEKTAARLAAELRAAGFEVTEHFGGTGVVAVLRNGPGPTLYIRSDLDALPVKEETGLPYASEVHALNLSGKDVPYDPSGTFDAKVLDSAMAKRMSFAARWGSADGTAFDADAFLQAHPQFDWQAGILKSRRAEPWVEFQAGEE